MEQNEFNRLQEALDKIRDLTCLSDILPTGYHGCVSAGVTTGSAVLISGAGPVGLAAAASAFLLGAAVVIIADLNTARLEHARSFGCETIDLSQGGKITADLLQATQQDWQTNLVAAITAGSPPDLDTRLQIGWLGQFGSNGWVLPLDGYLAKALRAEIQDLAVTQGMRTLRDSGIQLVADDVTTISEILRNIYVI